MVGMAIFPINYYFFFFSSRRRHTRLQGDWSSDVCSSDLSPMAKFSLWWWELDPKAPGSQLEIFPPFPGTRWLYPMWRWRYFSSLWLLVLCPTPPGITSKEETKHQHCRCSSSRILTRRSSSVMPLPFIRWHISLPLEEEERREKLEGFLVRALILMKLGVIHWLCHF